MWVFSYFVNIFCFYKYIENQNIDNSIFWNRPAQSSDESNFPLWFKSQISILINGWFWEGKRVNEEWVKSVLNPIESKQSSSLPSLWILLNNYFEKLSVTPITETDPSAFQHSFNLWTKAKYEISFKCRRMISLI